MFYELFDFKKLNHNSYMQSQKAYPKIKFAQMSRMAMKGAGNIYTPLTIARFWRILIRNDLKLLTLKHHLFPQYSKGSRSISC